MYLILVASVNENMRLARRLEAQLEALGASCECVDLVRLGIPMYDSIKEERDGIPEAVRELMGRMERAEGYVVVAPEYNGSIPPVLTSAIAWISRSGEDFRALFSGRFVQLASHSGSGGHDLMNAMRAQFTKLGAVVAPRQILITPASPLKEQSSEKILAQFTAWCNCPGA